MSKDSTLSRPHCRASAAARIAPPAGPDSTSRIGNLRAVSSAASPPPEVIMNSGQATPELAQRLVEPAEIAVHHRLHIGVGGGGRPALVLADLGRDLARQRERHAGHAFRPGCRACAARACRRDRRACSRSRPPRCRAASSFGASARTAASSSGIRMLPRPSIRSGMPKRSSRAHQRRRLHHEDVVLLEAVLEGDLDRIAEALGDDQRGLRALALDDRVGGERRAVDDQAEVGGLGARQLQDLGHAGHHAFLGRARRGQHLRARALAVPFEEQVGEGATDIDCQTCFFHELYAAVCWMLPPR